jgi:hypothetical protein
MVLHRNAVAFYSSAPSIPYQTGDPTIERSKVSTVITLLIRRALEWATAVMERGEEELGSYKGFMVLFRVVFDYPPEVRQGGEQLLQLQQGARTAAEYALTFQTVAASSGWNEPALHTLFWGGLCKEVQTELACRDDIPSFDALNTMAIRLDNLIRERWSPPRHSPPSFGCPEAESGNFIDQALASSADQSIPHIVSPVFWDVGVDIRQALEREPAPATCPPECIYIPTG